MKKRRRIEFELDTVLAFIFSGDTPDWGSLTYVGINDAAQPVSGPNYMRHRAEQRQVYDIYLGENSIATAQTKPHPILWIERESNLLRKAMIKYPEVRVNEL